MTYVALLPLLALADANPLAGYLLAWGFHMQGDTNAARALLIASGYINPKPPAQILYFPSRKDDEKCSSK